MNHINIRTDLVGGTKYRIRTRQRNQKYEREFVVTFLTESYGPYLVFDARPEFGNVSLDKNDVTQISLADPSESHYVNRIIR